MTKIHTLNLINFCYLITATQSLWWLYYEKCEVLILFFCNKNRFECLGRVRCPSSLVRLTLVVKRQQNYRHLYYQVSLGFL